MPLKDALAAERRVDLASLFCMVGRHGPAVALAVVATLFVLAGVIIYRTVRGKRRKAAAADGYGGTGASPEESRHSAESTDVSDESSSDVKDDDVIPSDFIIRHRPAAAAVVAAAAKKPPLCSPLNADLQAPENKQPLSDDTGEMKVMFDSFKAKETYSEEAQQGLPSDTATVAEMEVEHAVECRQGAAGDTSKDVGEDDNGSCLKEPELVNDENLMENEKVLKAEGEDVTTDKDAHSFNNHVETSSESNSEEPVTHIEDVPAPSASHGKSEEENPDGIDCTSSSNNSYPAITADAEAQISGIADFPELSVGCQPLMEDQTASCLDEGTGSTVLGSQTPSHETEVLPESNRSGSTVVLTEGCDDQVYDSKVQSCYDDQKSFQMINDEDFDMVTIAPYPETALVTVEEILCHSPSVCEEQKNDRMESDEVGVSSATDAVHCNRASLSAPLMSVDVSQPDMASVSQDQQSNLLENNEELSEVTSSVAPVMSKDTSPTMCQIFLPSFVQSEQRDNNLSSPGVGGESGISSMAVSPDLQDAGNEFGEAIWNTVVPEVDCELQSEGQTEAPNSLFADDVASSVTNEDTAGMAFGPHPSLCFQIPHSEHTDWDTFECFAANEDKFGHEIEDGYHRVMDQFTAQISATVTRFTEVLTIQRGMKAFFEVVETKEEKAGGSVEQREDAKEENYEKTEISIMEATMDYNEWFTESNCQVLPWLNLSAPSFGQDHTKTNQLPSEICQDNEDIPPSTEVQQTISVSLVDENTDNSKKVLTVQPMTQNVNVTFRVHYFTQSPYQTVAVTGDQNELGNWKGFIPLERAKDGHWAVVISLPAESHLEWKFVLLDKGEVCRWEECGNRPLDTGYGDNLLVHKCWGLL